MFENIQRVNAGAIDFEGYDPKKAILAELRKKPEIDYNKCKKLLFELISAAAEYYKSKYGTNGMQNIIMMYKRDIAERIYKQMMQHFYCDNGLIQEEVIGTRKYNLPSNFTFRTSTPLYGDFSGDIKSVCFTDISLVYHILILVYTGKFTIFFVHFFHFQHYGVFEGLNSYNSLKIIKYQGTLSQWNCININMEYNKLLTTVEIERLDS